MTPPLPAGFLRLPLAHRALHDLAARRPENGPGAVAAAVAAGYGIEVDVQASADGAAMVFHDDELGRLTGAAGPVRALDAAALGRLRLKGSDDAIPRLEEVLEIVGARVPLLIEVKDQSGRMAGSDAVLEAAVARALRGYPGEVAVMSFNPDSMAALAEAAPGVPRGLVTCGWTLRDAPPLSAGARARLRAIPDFGRVGAAFVSHHWRDLGRARIAALKAAGTPILCWTIRSPSEEAQARAVADGITFEGYLPALPG